MIDEPSPLCRRSSRAPCIAINMVGANPRTLRVWRRSGLRGRKGVSEIVGVLLMVAIVVIAAVIILVYVQGLFSALTHGASSTHVTIVGHMFVPGTYDSVGVLSLTLTNDGSTPIQTISVSCPAAYFATLVCNGLAMNPSPLPVGATASGSLPVSACSGGPPCLASSFTAGTTYTLMVTADFAGGSVQMVAVDVRSFS